MEVETPVMQSIAGGAAARPFATRHHALDRDLYLRVALELHLKRLVVGGMERVFEMNRCFRNEGLSTQHNPEFTMLEVYQAYADYDDFMRMTQEMIRAATEAVLGGTRVTYQGQDYELGGDWPRLSMEQAVLEHNPGLDAERLRDADYLLECRTRLGLENDPPGKRGLGQASGRAVRPHRGGPACRAGVHYRPSRRGLAAFARQRRRSRGHRPLRAVHRRAGTGERILGVERRRRPGPPLS